MAAERKHDPWLTFVRDVLDVPLNRSKADLVKFHRLAQEQYYSLVPIIEQYIILAEASETSAAPAKPVRGRRVSSKQPHLFDLLREKAFFPQNLDLARFAERIVPDMRTYRFDKMSRGDIAARIIEFVESIEASARADLETSMREALAETAVKPPRDIERRSFLSKWERIIKGAEH